METQNSTFNLKQRELFTKLLAQAKTRAQEEIESDYAVNKRVESDVLTKLAEEYGASEMVTKVQKLSKEFNDLKSALKTIGFDCDEDGDLSLRYDAPNALCEALENAKRSARKERDKVLKKYDLAVLAVLASEDVQEAKKIVEGLL
jgi:hypothetical protein